MCLDALEADRDNMRAALARYIATGQGEKAHRLAVALCAFWHDRGPAGEACDWLAQVLALRAPPDLRGRTLTRGSVIATWSGSSALAASWAQEGLGLAVRARTT
jgi:hypothetical protein